MYFFEHGGTASKETAAYDFSCNVNPLGIPGRVTDAVMLQWKENERYPDARCLRLRKAIAKQWNGRETQVICGNGASELIYGIVRARKPSSALLPAPTFSEYERALCSCEVPIHFYELKRDRAFCFDEDFLVCLEQQERNSMLFLCNPNNPVGNSMNKQLLLQILSLCFDKQIFVVLDECFLPFLSDYKQQSAKQFWQDYPHVFVLNAFTKLYGMPGIRLGYGVCADSKLIERIGLQLPSWNVSSVAQLAGFFALQETDYVEKSISYIAAERDYLQNGLRKQGFMPYTPTANFIFFEAPPQLDEQLLQRGIAIRSCENYRVLKKGDYRIAVRTHEENAFLLKQMGEIYG